MKAIYKALKLLKWNNNIKLSDKNLKVTGSNKHLRGIAWTEFFDLGIEDQNYDNVDDLPFYTSL